jgi:hypothetical protein
MTRIAFPPAGFEDAKQHCRNGNTGFPLEIRRNQGIS